MVTEPTREDRILDLFFTSNSSLVERSVVYPGISDHDGIPLIDMLTSPRFIKTNPRKLYKYHKANHEELEKDLAKLSSTITNNKDSSVEDDWTCFRDGVFLAMDEHIPFKFSSKKNNSPWISSSIKRKLRRKQRIYNRARATGSAADKQKFRAIRKEIQKETKIAYWKWVRSSCIESPKQFWSFVKKLRKDSMGIPALRSGGQLVSESTGKAEILNHQFESVFTNENPMVNLPTQQVHPPMPEIIVSEEGVFKLLNEQDENKAPGPDGVPAKILKLFAAQLTPALTHIFNKSLTTGILPEDWLSANISPIFKKGDRATAANYRPVSLTPICCKLFEHILHSNIMRHFSEHQILTDRQHGFRANHSCESQLVLTVNDLAKSIDAKTPVDMIIMDFSKAFDTVPHNRLLHKLQNFGITGRTHTWISNFLTKRRQRVVVDGDHSQWVHVRSGVPQGTVLGPLLFLAYINDLPDKITSEVRLFADDCVMYRPIHDDSDVERLQTDLNTLSLWQDNWQMQFNAKKCFVLKVSHSRTKSTHQYTLGQSILQETDSHSYLGVSITKDLKWDSHINQCVSKAKRVLGLVCRNLHPCNTDLKATAYKSLVRPHLEYSCTVWDPHNQGLIQKLEAVQRRAARFACRNYDRHSSVTKMLEDLKWDSLQMRRQANRLTLLYKSINGQVAIPAQTFLTPVVRPTRRNNSQAFIRPQASKDAYKNSFFPKTINEWNILPEAIVKSPTSEIFKEQVINHLRSSHLRG